MPSLFPGFKEFDISVTPDVSIHALYAGQGPPLLLLHGFPQTHMIWHKIASRLTDHFTVVLVDLRGYGASSKPSVGDQGDHSLYAKSAMANDCVAVMSHLGFETFMVCGHDRGGRVAHKLCVDHPSKVRKAMVLDICPTKAMYESTDATFAFFYWHWFFLTQPAPFPEQILMASPEVIAKKCFGGRGNDVFTEQAVEGYVMQFRGYESTHAMCEDYRAGMQEDIAEQKADEQAGRKITCPLRVIWGKKGVIEAKFDAVKEWRVQCEHVDPGSCALECGHFIPEEEPEMLLKHMKDFFQ